jgi:hypothetical protein
MGILKGLYLAIKNKSQWKINQNGNYKPMGISQNEIINIIKTKMALLSLHKTQSYC